MKVTRDAQPCHNKREGLKTCRPDLRVVLCGPLLHLLQAPLTVLARGGSRAAALELDKSIHEVQNAHPNYVRVDNSTNFDGKLRRATDAVIANLGL